MKRDGLLSASLTRRLKSIALAPAWPRGNPVIEGNTVQMLRREAAPRRKWRGEGKRNRDRALFFSPLVLLDNQPSYPRIPLKAPASLSTTTLGTKLWRHKNSFGDTLNHSPPLLRVWFILEGFLKSPARRCKVKLRKDLWSLACGGRRCTQSKGWVDTSNSSQLHRA